MHIDRDRQRFLDAAELVRDDTAFFPPELSSCLPFSFLHVPAHSRMLLSLPHALSLPFLSISFRSIPFHFGFGVKILPQSLLRQLSYSQ